MANRRKEIAKFFCGAEAFHTIVHTSLWLSGTTLSVFGITATPKLSMAGVIVNGVIALILGIYAWRPSRQESAPVRKP